MFAKYIESENDQATFFECLLVMVATGTTSLIFALLTGLKWQGSIVVMASVAVLVGGIVFSLLEMYRLGYQAGRSEPALTSQQRSTIILPLNTISEQSTIVDEACFHHEDHPESCGEDQGQLLSHLSGSTPFLERLG